MSASTLILLAALSLTPEQPGGLTLTNLRGTHGLQGPARTEKGAVPGDSVYLCFDIEGITVAADGKVRYSVVTEVTDSKGKAIFKHESRELETTLSLGGTQVPGFSQIDVGLDQAAGEYTLKLTVTDLAAKKSATFSHKVQINPAGFSLVRFSVSRDQQANIPVSVPATGEAVWLQFGVLGFMRDGTTKQPNVTVEVQVLDESGKPVGKPQAGVVNKDVPDTVIALPLQFLLSLNRAGKFTLAVTATDQLSKKTTKTTLPLNVVAAK